MQFKALFNTLALALFIATAQADIAPGTYNIVNRALSDAGAKLAITSNGKNKAVTATKLNQQEVTQQWEVGFSADGKTQSISPSFLAFDTSGYQCAWYDGVVTLSSARDYVWTITKTNDGFYTIQDGELTKYWGLDSAAEGVKVIGRAGNGDEKQNWFFEAVKSPFSFPDPEPFPLPSPLPPP